MKFNDVFGLGKMLPIDKLIDILSRSVGRVSKPYFDKKDIDTKAYEIRKLAEARADEMKIITNAIKENSSHTGGIEYKEEKISITSSKESSGIKGINNDPLSLEERAQERILFQASRAQLNVESIASFAAEKLKEEASVTDEPVEEGWSDRFFKYAEEISDEELQEIWGRILASEIKSPKTYSLRTLELLRNLSKSEAEILVKVANLAIRRGNEYFLFKGDNDDVLEKYGIGFSDILQLIEIGLIQPGDFMSLTLKNSLTPQRTAFTAGNIILSIDKKENTGDISISLNLFTKSGNELLQLINQAVPFEYLKEFANKTKREGINVQYGYILERTSTHIRHTQPLMEFTD